MTVPFVSFSSAPVVRGESDAYWCIEKFYNLSKEERDAVVEFVNSI